ncbi:MAG: hypothetical protein WC297_02075 [Candidatus Paceibacterota bacterium]|jgi:hypothetical protein
MKSNRQWISDDTAYLVFAMGACISCIAMMIGPCLSNWWKIYNLYFLTVLIFFLSTLSVAIIINQREKIKYWILRTADLFIVICIGPLLDLTSDDEAENNIT